VLSAGPHHHQAGHAADRAQEWLSWARTWSTGELCTLAERVDQTLLLPADANCSTGRGSKDETCGGCPCALACTASTLIIDSVPAPAGCETEGEGVRGTLPLELLLELLSAPIRGST
jgi:hypothetical protein